MIKEGFSQKRTAKERAFQVLKERIMRQELRAGDPLPEVAIAKSLGVSRTPVREAILQAKKALIEHMENMYNILTRIIV